MRLVVADTSPINYLILIGEIGLLRQLYSRVAIPQEVFRELSSENAPPFVVSWIQNPPDWLDVRSAPSELVLSETAFAAGLGAGEVGAIRLALMEQDSLLLIDELRGREAARNFGLSFVGILGILLDAYKAGFIDLREALEKLKKTNFRVSQTLLDKVIESARRN